MLKAFIIVLFITTYSYAQMDTNERVGSGRNITLFGESHFVKEKYDEIKTIVMDSINDLENGANVTFYFELPYTLNYAFYKLESDSTILHDWFNHLYQSKEQKPSNFWTDYRDFIFSLIEYCDKKGVELNMRAIDTELEFRRTAYVLSSFKNKLNNDMDSLLNLKYIRNDSTTRSFLLNYVTELSKITEDIVELEILNKLKKSLPIDCTICQERDHFMFKRFKENYTTTQGLTFCSFGLDHIINAHDFSGASDIFKIKHKIDTLNYQSIYSLINEYVDVEIYRIGILAFNQEMKFSKMLKPKNYHHIMKPRERAYINSLINNNDVVRIRTSDHQELSALSKHLDYVVIYESSIFR